MFRTIQWRNNCVRLLDQIQLPGKEVYVDCRNYEEVAQAIEKMIVRGAPAIGVTAAFGVALGAIKAGAKNLEDFKKEFNKICIRLSLTRPTAVNLFWAINKMREVVMQNKHKSIDTIKRELLKEAKKIYREDIYINQSIGGFGNRVIKYGDTVLTHCNAGALATAGFGTALGVIRASVKDGKKIKVFANETRPFLQGARLTAWELLKDKIPVTLICDNMAGYFMKRGEISKVIVGADRIAANGDVANKIGTYSVAVLAKENNIPFYVAAPISTIDSEIKDGSSIPIEKRKPSEVTTIAGKSIAPRNVNVENPAFDVTPNRYISGIITEKGILRKPYTVTIKRLLKGKK
ncbi:MAG: S-methyl-5-thioribose-1-phosphate isomerase [Candidatus Schekmanbacteria bacterium RBG_16_38_11]|uniref:Methylthioribose-1-phosphate isomerase n=1 Tax=Candidatus Schekmanbacteria bacterium RBG_16_38_11 TaxID=1817880 RepID=A0A1F7RV84_9BACT|nr:MAG: S-methyl-5-thioribose-1-phosphate isomerase [Candidatus Schekmanbacteria bacterium RBG_16_38_11]